MFGRLIWTTLLAAAGYVVWRILRGDHQPPTMYQPVQRPESPPAQMQGIPPAVSPEAVSAPSVAVEELPPVEAPPAIEPTAVADTPQAAGETNEPSAGVEIEAYCMRCRERRMIRGALPATTANGRHGMRGTCTICGAKVFTFVKET